MAREYGKVSPKFWTGETGRQMRACGDSERLAALYLLTCGSAHMSGLYYLPVALMAHELGWAFEGASKALRSLQGVGFCDVDETRDLVWVREMVRYQVGEELKPGDNRVAHIEAQLVEYAGSPLAVAFRRKYYTTLQLRPPTTLKDGLPKGASKGLVKALPKGLLRGSETPPKPESSEQRTDLKDTHRAGVPPRHCAYHSPSGLDVPHALHGEFVRKLMAAGATGDDANATLFEWYRATEADWAAKGQVVGDDAFRFWRARWREAHGTTAGPESPLQVAGLAGGGVAAPSSPPLEAWRCDHTPRCPHRTACALTTVKDVRAGRLTVMDVPVVLRAEVLEFLEAGPGPEAVQ